MQVVVKYQSRSGLRTDSAGSRRIHLVTDQMRNPVILDAALTSPVVFRDALSVFHETVLHGWNRSRQPLSIRRINVRRPNDGEPTIRNAEVRSAGEIVAAGNQPPPMIEQDWQHLQARKRYLATQSELHSRLQYERSALWRLEMPFDPVITVAEDCVFLEGFSADESSYACLSIDRGMGFTGLQEAVIGTTAVDYSLPLFADLQSLRTRPETRICVSSDGVDFAADHRSGVHEETINLPQGWLSGFLQLQAMMALPTTKVTLSIDAVYSLLAWLKQHREKTGPRALRFELQDGRSPRMILEPWETVIESHGPKCSGAVVSPVRIWGRRQLLSLARVLPLASSVDVYLLGTGMPSFWVVRMKDMGLTIGLSGWTSRDGNRGAGLPFLLPSTEPVANDVDRVTNFLNRQQQMSLGQAAKELSCSSDVAVSALNHSILRGQAMFDLSTQQYRCRQLLPTAIPVKDSQPVHPESLSVRGYLQRNAIRIDSRNADSRGGMNVVGKVEHQSCEVLIDADGIIRGGKCRCNWHQRSGVRSGACRHLQSLRDYCWYHEVPPSGK
jgi:hypothetical protein